MFIPWKTRFYICATILKVDPRKSGKSLDFSRLFRWTSILLSFYGGARLVKSEQRAASTSARETVWVPPLKL